jgi:hypothetical protein
VKGWGFRFSREGVAVSRYGGTVVPGYSHSVSYISTNAAAVACRVTCTLGVGIQDDPIGIRLCEGLL